MSRISIELLVIAFLLGGPPRATALDSVGQPAYPATAHLDGSGAPLVPRVVMVGIGILLGAFGWARRRRSAGRSFAGVAPSDAEMARLRKLVRKEIAVKRVDRALWARVVAECGGNHKAARDRYIDQRALAMREKLQEGRTHATTHAPPLSSSSPRRSAAVTHRWPFVLVAMVSLAIILVLARLDSSIHAPPTFADGLDAYLGGNYERALAVWCPLAERGFPLAQLRLGLMYQEGQGIDQDLAKAAGWYRKAAEQGDAEAQYNLGEMYEGGMGVPQDEEQAQWWYREAAEQYRRWADRGDPAAQVSLGGMYETGYGVEQDDRRAVSWYRKAAEQGSAVAQLQLGWMYAQGTGVLQDEGQVAYWYFKAAEQGNAEAQVRLGYLFERGIGVPQDHEQAERWYRKAAQRSDFDAKAMFHDLARK